MNPLMGSLISKLGRLDRQFARQGVVATRSYSAALMTGVVLVLVLPLPHQPHRECSDDGCFGLHDCKIHGRNGVRCRISPDPSSDTESLRAEVWPESMRASISCSRHLLFAVRHRRQLFWMGLPGPGSVEQKAALDCVFLAASVLVFTAIYL